jgi:hypothetical protein
MRRRRLLLGAFALPGVAGLLIALLASPRRPALTREHYHNQITIGMTEGEVEAILGPPLTGWEKGNVTLIAPLGCVPFYADNLEKGDRVWVGEKDAIIINFEAGVVVDQEWVLVVTPLPSRPTLWDRLRRLLPW